MTSTNWRCELELRLSSLVFAKKNRSGGRFVPLLYSKEFSPCFPIRPPEFTVYFSSCDAQHEPVLVKSFDGVASSLFSVVFLSLSTLSTVKPFSMASIRPQQGLATTQQTAATSSAHSLNTSAFIRPHPVPFGTLAFIWRVKGDQRNDG